MRRLVLSIGISLSAILSFAGQSQAAPRDKLIGASAGSSTAFTASFSKGLKGWTHGDAAHWKTSGATVTFSGNGDELLAPFSTAKLHDFAVQAMIKAVGKPLQATSGYGVVVRAQTPQNGITGGSVTSDNPEYNLPLLIWGDSSIGGSPATLHAGFNLYRIEVHGTDYSLFINGTHIVSFTITDMSAAGTYKRIGLWASAQKIQAKALTVTRLGTATALPAAPHVQQINLQTGDVPSAMQPLGNSYITDEELAQLNSATVDSVTSTGLLLSHQTGYATSPVPASGPYGVFSYVYAYSTPDTAATGLTQDVGNEQGTKDQNPNFSMGTAPDVGDEAHSFMYDYTETDSGATVTGTIVAIFFRRGTFEVTVFEDFIAGSLSPTDMLAQTTALAKTMDARIQQLG